VGAARRARPSQSDVELASRNETDGSAGSAAAGTAGPPAAAGPAVSFAEREITASEGQTVVPIEIRRRGGAGEISVLWWTDGGTATAGNDFADLGGVIETFAPGETSRTVFIPITNDSLPERRESFVVHLALQSPDGKPHNEPQSVRVTIVDDDF
jgi:hypothetical protein